MNDAEAPAAGPADPPERGGPARPGRRVIAATLLAAVVAIGALALVGLAGGGDTGDAHVMGTSAPLDLTSVGDDVAAHYRFAEAHQSELTAIPCFCGCEEFLAHGDLYDCFVRTDGAGFDSHAAGCGVCIGEAAVAAELLGAGTAPDEVAARIVEQFGSSPITSPDQTVPRP